MQRFRDFLAQATAPVVSALLVGLLTVFLFLYRLSHITWYLASPQEAAVPLSVNSFHGLLASAVSAPYTILLHGFIHLQSTLLFMRLTSVVFGLIAAALVYFVLFRLYGYKIAALGSLMFAGNSYVLHLVRTVDPAVLQLLPALILLILVAFMHKTQKTGQYIAWLIGSIFVLYVPGGVWLLLLVGLLHFKKFLAIMSQSKVSIQIAGIFLWVVALLPLLYTLYHGIRIGHYQMSVGNWLGVNLGHGHIFLTNLLHNFVHVPLYLFLHQPDNPAWHLGRLPVLSVITTAFVVIGAYVHYLHWHDARYRTNVLFIAAGWLILTLGDSDIALILGPLLVVAASGIAYMLKQWYSVFPRNPIARIVGIGLLITIIAINVAYNTRQYYVAWPHYPPVKDVFVKKV